MGPKKLRRVGLGTAAARDRLDVVVVARLVKALVDCDSINNAVAATTKQKTLRMENIVDSFDTMELYY